jgi:hypothetical protein
MAESLAQKAARARRGERVTGGTEVPTGEAGTESYYDPQSGTYKQRPTVRLREEAPTEQHEGLAGMLAKRKKKKLEETPAEETKPTGGGGFSGDTHARRAGLGPTAPRRGTGTAGAGRGRRF